MERTSVGGQAVIEGIMMKNNAKVAVAIRKPDKEIEVKRADYESLKEKHLIFRLPIIRGVVTFLESMVTGMKMLTYSASFYEEEEEESKFDQWLQGKSEKVVMGVTVFISIVLAIGIFMILPYLLTGWLEAKISNHTLTLILEGVFRIGIFLGYMLLISQMEDIQRVFMYHGAEHKTINCLEHGEDLTVENIKRHSRLHKRCGTSFLFLVMIISIFFFFFIRADQVWLKILYRLLLIPVISGVSYEFIRFAGNHDGVIVRILSTPGMMLQKLTTREPDDGMIEVAIEAVSEVMDWEAYVKAVRNGEIED